MGCCISTDLACPLDSLESTLTIIAIGLNHKSAPLPLMEKVNFGIEEIPKVLTEVGHSEVVSEAVVLSTCNRTEFYVHAERFHDGFRDVRRALGLLSGVDVDHFDAYLYVHYHAEAAQHLFEVTAGLDSAILGEHEILGQVARSWELARTEGSSGPLLNLLFQRAIESGKRVRTETEIGRSTASLSQIAIGLLAERRADLDQAKVLLIGAGDVGAGVASALRREFNVELLVTNRTPARADELVERIGGIAVPFVDVDQHLGDIDVLVTATGAPGQVVDAAALERARRSDSRRPLVVLDMAVPRDVDPATAALPDVDLIDLPELQAFANQGLETRRQHLDSAKVIVDAELERYEAASSARQVAPLIGGLHTWAEGIRQGELERYANRLATMNSEDRDAVEALTRSIVAKVLHQPTIGLKDAAGTARGERLADAMRELFDQS